MNHHRDSDHQLRVTRIRPGLSPDPCDGPFAVERMTALTHDMANLLDGSLRCLLLARRSIDAGAQGASLDAARRQLETVYTALERMADLVHGAMCGAGAVSPAAQQWVQRSARLGEAIVHAAEVLRPESEQNGVRIETRVSEDAGALPAGPLYSVLLNGMRNALDSIIRAQRERRGLSGGLIEVSANATAPGSAGVIMLHIEIRDDGRGVASVEEGRRALDFGYSTKPGSCGVGLALARDVVREVGGSIELMLRQDRAASDRPGALLRIDYPVIAPPEEPAAPAPDGD